MKCVSTGSGTSGSAYQMIPVKSGQRVYSDIWIDVSTISAGNIGAYLKFFADSAGANMVGSAVTAATFSAVTSGFVESVAEAVVPAGANYLMVEVQGLSTFTGTANIDDIAVAII
jgi:hypothetical protein